MHNVNGKVYRTFEEGCAAQDKRAPLKLSAREQFALEDMQVDRLLNYARTRKLCPYDNPECTNPERPIGEGFHADCVNRQAFMRGSYN